MTKMMHKHHTLHAFPPEITEEQLRHIEAACAPSIASVGFRLFGSLAAARNASLGLASDLPLQASRFVGADSGY